MDVFLSSIIVLSDSIVVLQLLLLQSVIFIHRCGGDVISAYTSVTSHTYDVYFSHWSCAT